MLALERLATVEGTAVRVRAQPYGGAVRILDVNVLRDDIGDFRFDSERSQAEADFRILIRPSAWEAVKQFCLRHLQIPHDGVLESDPHRELVEEFADGLHIDLQTNQYVARPCGFVVEDEPTPTDNIHGRGCPTVRLYRVFEVRIVDEALRQTMLMTSRRYADQDLQRLAVEDAQNGGKGRTNTILTLPLDRVVESYLALDPHSRYSPRTVEGHRLDASVLTVLGEPLAAAPDPAEVP